MQPSVLVHKAGVGSGQWSYLKSARLPWRRAPSATTQPSQHARKDESRSTQLLFCRPCTLRRFSPAQQASMQPSVLVRKASVGRGHWRCCKSARPGQHWTQSATTQPLRHVRKEEQNNVESGRWCCWRIARHGQHQMLSATMQPSRHVRKEQSSSTQLLFCRLCALRTFGLTRRAIMQPSVPVRKASVGRGHWSCWKIARPGQLWTLSAIVHQLRHVRKEDSNSVRLPFYRPCALRRRGPTLRATMQLSVLVRKACAGSAHWNCWKIARLGWYRTPSATTQLLQHVRKEDSHGMRLLFCRLCAFRRRGLTQRATMQPSARVRKAFVESRRWSCWKTAKPGRCRTPSRTSPPQEPVARRPIVGKN